MDDGKVIQEPGQAPSTEPSPPATGAAPIGTPPQPLTKELVAQMIAEATAQAITSARELGRRELQSQQDRNRAETARLEHRARLAETAFDAAQTRVRATNPDAADDLELAGLRAREQSRLTIEQEEALHEQQAEFHQGFIAYSPD